MAGLNVSDVVNVDINLSPLAAPLRNFGVLCIAGSSDVIDPVERLREYTTLDGVASDFGSAAPEYLAADLFFSQNPQPAIVYIGRFAQTASSGVLHGAIQSPSAQMALLSRLQTITAGTMTIPIDGTARTVQPSSGFLRSAAFNAAGQAALRATMVALTDAALSVTVDGAVVHVPPTSMATISTDVPTAMNDIASKLTAGMGGKATMTFDAGSTAFLITSHTTGSTSTVSYASAGSSGTDVSATLQLTAASGAVPPSAGTLGMNFTGIATLNGAATIIGNSITGAKCWWDGTRFHIESLSTGPTSSVGYAGPAGTGTDVSTMLGLTKASGASVPVAGIAAETALQAAIALRAFPSWYGLTYATATPISDSDIFAVAQFIEGANPTSIFGYTTQNTQVLDPTVTTDICSLLKASVLMRTFGDYSSSSPYAVASIFGRAFTVDFEGNNTTITLKFKQEPGVTYEQLTENQATALRSKHCNVFVYYANDTAIIQEGVMANGFFFDEVHGTDWLQNRIQTDVYDVLYTAPTKIPQTDQGVHILVTTVENSCAQGVTNGLIAPGQWNAPGMGQIVYGQMLPKGYYVYAPLVASQPQSIREQRIAPTIQAAIKLAGAIHFANVIVNVNR